MIYWCIKHEYIFSKSLILTFVRKNRVTQIRLYGLESSSRIPCCCANYRTTDEEQFISLIFLASFMAITLTLFFFFLFVVPEITIHHLQNLTFLRKMLMFFFHSNYRANVRYICGKKNTNVGCGCWQQNISYIIAAIPFYSTYRNNE